MGNNGIKNRLWCSTIDRGESFGGRVKQGREYKCKLLVIGNIGKEMGYNEGKMLPMLNVEKNGKPYHHR